MPYNAGPTKKRKEGIPFFSSSMVMAMATCKSKKKKKIIENKESWRMLKNLVDWGASAEEEEEEEENTYRESGLGRVYLV